MIEAAALAMIFKECLGVPRAEVIHGGYPQQREKHKLDAEIGDCDVCSENSESSG